MGCVALDRPKVTESFFCAALVRSGLLVASRRNGRVGSPACVPSHGTRSLVLSPIFLSFIINMATPKKVSFSPQVPSDKALKSPSNSVPPSQPDDEFLEKPTILRIKRRRSELPSDVVGTHFTSSILSETAINFFLSKLLKLILWL